MRGICFFLSRAVSQREIVTLFAKGDMSSEVAHNPGLSIRTAEAHRSIRGSGLRTSKGSIHPNPFWLPLP
jgi:FixJ family two-component response regulator